jgi:L-2-hydroxyglutarate oxidase LhgO
MRGSKSADFVIIGAGVVGLAVARELKTRYPDQSICILEKEASVGQHSSGRNSGVLHSGIYYPPNSIKAKVCSLGAKEMAAYCEQYNLPLNAIGKVLVPVRVEDAPQLDLLADRAGANQVEVERLCHKELKELEPDVRSATGDALLVPATSVINPMAIMTALAQEVERAGVKIHYGFQLKAIDQSRKKIQLSSGSINYGHVINSAGLHADSIAHMFGAGLRYSLLPFKGIYWKLDAAAELSINHLIYPVPDLRVPFLGVHTTTTVDGDIFLGPTAVPAFGRENYRGLEGVEPKEMMRILFVLARQYISGKEGFRRLAWQEGKRYFKTWFTEAAQALLPQLKAKHLLPANKVAIRAQMFDKKERCLITDFLIEQGQDSTHILNAISPAFTSAFPFARLVLDQYIEQR